jgi:hypothetical protein
MVRSLQVTCRSLHVIALADGVQSGDVSFMIYDMDNLDKGWFCSGLCEAQKVR